MPCPKLWLASIVLAAAACPTAIARERAELALDLAQALAENRERLRDYGWRSRTEITISGQRQWLRTETVRHGPDGKRIRKVLAASELPGAADTLETELGRGVRERLGVLIDSYTYPSPGALVDFFEQATFEPVLDAGGLTGAVRIRGEGLLQDDDQVVLVVELEAGLLHELTFSATLDGVRYEVAARHEQLPDGPFFPQTITVTAPASEIRGEVVVSDVKQLARPAPTAPDSPPQAGAPADPAPAEPSGWPRTYERDGDELVIYQPQLDTWDDKRVLEAVAAVSVTPSKGEPAFGAVRLRARTRLRATDRSVLIDQIEALEVTFPGEQQGEAGEDLATLTRRLLPQQALRMPLEQLEASLEDIEQRHQEVEISLEPPRVILSLEPAVLVTLDGEPTLEATGVEGLFQVVNTEWTLFAKPASDSYALLFNGGWLQAQGLEATWSPGKAWPELSRLPDEPRWQDARATTPGKTPAAWPAVKVSTVPSELLVFDGQPQYVPIRGTSLLYVSNSEDDVLFHSRERSYYVLMAGRWFRAKKLAGPWESAQDALPRDLSQIPADHPMARVRPSVPGTDEAKEAVLLAEVPREAKVKRDEATLEVTYEGDPEFRAIGDTGVAYAVNTVFDVLRAGGRYYCCHQGVWFEAPSPTGPWELCEEVPAEIYAIPASSPKYRVTYVRVRRHDPVYCYYYYGTGYLGVYYWHGVVVYGTGWYVRYPPYYWRHYHYRYYPVYGRTAYHAYYGPRVSAYGYSSYYHAPYGTYVRTSAWGTVNGRPVSVHRQAAFGPYASWGRGVVAHDGGWAKWARHTTPAGSRVGVTTSGGGRGAAGTGPRGSGGAYRTGSGDLYVGRDGQVYRRTSDGWQKREGGGWVSPSRPARPELYGSGGTQRPARPQPTQRPARPQPTQRPARPQPTQRPARPTQRPAYGNDRVQRDLERTRDLRQRAQSRPAPSWQQPSTRQARPQQPRTRYPTRTRTPSSYGGARRVGGGGVRGGGGGRGRGAGS